MALGTRHKHKDDLRAMIVSLREKGWSLPRIGKALGKHHTTILYHLEAMDQQVLTPREWNQYLVHRGAGL